LVKYVLGNEAFGKAFSRIEFSDKIRRALDLAKRPEVSPDAIALHLRAGDIIYGSHRFTGRFTHKVASYRLVSAFAAEQRARARQLILFGQDDELGRAMASAHGAIWAADLRPAELSGPAEQAFFDVGLMTRCDRFVCGRSDFAELAAAIKGRRPTFLNHHWRTSDTVDRLLSPSPPAVEAAASYLQKAFAYWSAARLLLARDALDFPRAADCLDKALTHDPGNYFYMFVKSVALYSIGRGADADILIASMATGDDKLIFLLANENAAMQPYLSLLRKSASGNSAWASLCLAFDRAAPTNDCNQHARSALRLPSLSPQIRNLLERSQSQGG
jgi:hypothetical protein